jgi:probable selenium-dependent hydroxylase accessory protein YqeC
MDPQQKVIYSVIEKFVKRTAKEEAPFDILSDSLGLKEREVISLVGAGGKTTLMFRLAGELFQEGKKVVTTTTTKILEPGAGERGFLLIDPDEDKTKRFVEQHLAQYHHITLAGERLASGKLKGVSSCLVNDLWNLQEIDYIIIEADGAAGCPVKAPRENEPVLPFSTTLVVAMLGVDGVGKELIEGNVFQRERISNITKVPIGEKMTSEAMAILLTHPDGIFKGAHPSWRVVVFLNKVDILNGMAKAKEITQKIFEKRHPQIERVVLGQLKGEPPVAEVIFP